MPIVSRTMCNGCGLCVRVCPDDVFVISEGKASPVGIRCMGCGHCVAVCPKNAVSLENIRIDLEFKTFQSQLSPISPGRYDTAELVRLMRSRRSCRNYQGRVVPPDILEDLIKIGTTAPSGTNSQRWTFTLLPDRQAVVTLGNLIAAYFKKLNRLAEITSLRKILKFFGKNSLDRYYRRHYKTTKKGLDEWEKSNRDRLFHGAPAAIIVGSSPGASCPVEDALLATQNILLAAHSMGLGSCLIGFAVAAMERDPSIQKALGIPDGEAIHAVIALGFPDEKYQQVSGRKVINPRYFRGQNVQTSQILRV